MINSITIGTLTFGTYASGYLFRRFSGFGFPEVRLEIQSRGNYHGAVLGMHKYGRRAMTIEGEIVGSSAADYEAKRRALEQVLTIKNGLQTVIFNTRGGLAIEAECIVSSALDVPYQSGKVIMGDFRLELVAPYPFLLGATLELESVLVYSGGGAAIPAAIPFSIATGGSGAEVIANDGNGEAFPVIRIYGALQNPSITNETTGESLSIVYTLLSSTDYIEIDMYNRTVLLNGVTNIMQYVSGDWWALQPGDNTIKLTASSNTVDAHADIEYRDAYLGI